MSIYAYSVVTVDIMLTYTVVVHFPRQVQKGQERKGNRTESSVESGETPTLYKHASRGKCYADGVWLGIQVDEDPCKPSKATRHHIYQVAMSCCLTDVSTKPSLPSGALFRRQTDFHLNPILHSTRRYMCPLPCRCRTADMT